MSDTLHGSLGKTVVSLLTAALALAPGANRCLAGDKIEFTVPGNTALAQKPERETKIADDQAAPHFDTGSPAPVMADYSEPTIVIQNDRNDRRGRNDRDKRSGLHAWDSGMRPSSLEDRDDLLSDDVKPRSSGLTNSYDAKSEWDQGSALSWSSDRAHAAKENADHAESLFGFSKQRSQSQDGSPYRTSMDPLSVLGRDENSERDARDPNKDSRSSGLSAWGKLYNSPKEGYAERVQEYRTMYDTPGLTVDKSDDHQQFSQSSAPGVGDNPLANLNSGDGVTQRDPQTGAFSEFDSVTKSDASASHYSPSGFQALTHAPAANPTRPSLLNSLGGNGGPMAAQPAILPFPKKPGSIFQ